MTPSDIQDMVILNDQTWHRLMPFFYLGLSASKILQAQLSGIEVVRESLQLFEEWEYHFSSFSVQSVKYVMGRNLSTAFPEAETEQVQTSYTISKFNNDVVYERLQCPHVAFELSYAGVLHVLCDTFSKLYEKMISQSSYRYH
jgi:hypothetical protein